VALLATACAPLAWIASVRAAQAKVGEGSLQIGRELSQMMRGFGIGSQLRINGNTVFAGGRHVNAQLGVVLDHFEKHCNEFGWDMRADLDTIGHHRGGSASSPIAPTPRAHNEDAWSFTLGKKRTDSEGLIICLAPKERQSGFRHFLEQARAATETGEIGDVGQIRYLYARKGASSGTDIVTVYTLGDFNMNRLLFTKGDVPGNDLPDVPRPSHATRVLFVELVDSPYVVRSYTTPDSAESTLREYQKGLPARRWKLVEADNSGTDTLVFEKDGAGIIVTATEQGGMTRLDILQLGSRGFAVSNGQGGGT